MARDRLQAIDADFNVVLEAATGTTTRDMLFRAYAENVLQNGIAQNKRALGYEPEHTIAYAGAKRNDLAMARANDLVVIEFNLVLDVIEWIDAQLILHSPVLTGAYAQSHAWFTDSGDPMDPMAPVRAESYSVLSTLPYARKIERGLSPMAPDGVYEAVATLARQRFGNVAAIKFEYRSFPGGAIGAWSRTNSAAALARDIRGGDPRRHEEWLQRQPSIYIDAGI